ncbi:MAG: hypothetical protein AABZ15_07780 [Nitrospirota bacterium]
MLKRTFIHGLNKWSRNAAVALTVFTNYYMDLMVSYREEERSAMNI